MFYCWSDITIFRLGNNEPLPSHSHPSSPFYLHVSQFNLLLPVKVVELSSLPKFPVYTLFWKVLYVEFIHVKYHTK